MPRQTQRPVTLRSSPAEVLPFLQRIAEEFDRDDNRLVFADYLDERGTTPVRSQWLTEWVRLAWLRNRPADLDRSRLHSRCRWHVYLDLEGWLNDQGQPDLDHWGSTEIAGITCLVSEPYLDFEDGLQALRPLAQVVGGVDVACRASYHRPPSTIRVLLFPPLATIQAEIQRSA